MILWLHHGYWCPSCREALSELDAAAADGIVVVSVSPDDVAEVRSLRAELGLRGTVLSDPRSLLPAALGLGEGESVRPTAVVLDARLTVQNVVRAVRPSDRLPVGRVVEAALRSPRGSRSPPPRRSSPRP